MDMYTPERRRAARICCQIPILVRCAGRTLETVSADLSRVGTRVRIPYEALGLTGGAALADLSRQAMHILGERVTVELHPDALGDLVRRTARPVRFACARGGQEYVEIGFDLRDPLTDMEAGFLGLALPPLFEEADVPTAGVGTFTAPAPRQDLALVFCAQDDEHIPPLRAVPTYLGAGGAQADLGDARSLPVLVEQPCAAGVMTALAGAYGSEPRSVLLMQSEAVWSGSVRLQAVDVRPQDGRVLLQVGFSSPIPEGARARLGL